MGIKNFQAPKSNVILDKENPFIVKDIMSTNIIAFKPEQSITEVINILIDNKISGGPVVNNNNELIGIISEGDCIKQISLSRYHNLPMEDETVEKNMITNVETIDSNLNIFDAANKFLTSKIRRFPIIENNKLIGLISQKDILKAAINLKN